jgi:hypothetical protein
LSSIFSLPFTLTVVAGFFSSSLTIPLTLSSSLHRVAWLLDTTVTPFLPATRSFKPTYRHHDLLRPATNLLFLRHKRHTFCERPRLQFDNHWFDCRA